VVDWTQWWKLCDSYGKTKQKVFFSNLGQFQAWWLWLLIWFLPWRFQTNGRLSFIDVGLVSGALHRRAWILCRFIHRFFKACVFLNSILFFFHCNPLVSSDLVFGRCILSYLIFWFGMGRRFPSNWSFQNLGLLFLFAFLISFLLFFFNFPLFSAFAVSAGISARILKVDSPKFLLTFSVRHSHSIRFFDSRARSRFWFLTGMLVLTFLILGPKGEFFKLP